MPSFEIQADIFTRLSVFDSPKGSSNTFKTHKNISLYFKRRYLIIYNYLTVITTNFSALTAGRDVTKLAGPEVIVVGDGHCLLHAFAMSLEEEKITVSSIEDLCSKLKNEIEQHLSFYRPFLTN